MRKRRSLMGFLIIFILLLAGSPWAVRWIQRTFLSPDLALQIEREVAIPFSGNWGVFSGGEGLFLVRNAEIRYFHPRQEEDWAFGTETLAPVATARNGFVYLMETSPRYLLKINQQGHMLYQQAANRSAERMRASDEEYLLLQHPPENRLTPFSILDPEGRVMGSILLTEGEILKTYIASEHNRVLISVLRLAGSGYETALLGYDLQGVLQLSKSFPDRLIVDLTVTKEGKIVVLTDQELQVMELNMEEIWQSPVDPYYLSQHDGEQLWVLAHRAEEYTGGEVNSDDETVLTHIRFDREESIISKDPAALTGISLGEEFILARTNRGIKIYHPDGRLIDEQMFQDEVEEAFALAGNRIALLRRGQILFYTLQTDS